MIWSRESRQERGYGAAWDRVRRIVLQRDCGICQPCLKEGRVHAGTEVDHIISKAKAEKQGWTQHQVDHPDNLQAINRDCHKAKTQEEQGKKHRPKMQIGPDGWPVRTR